MLCFSRRAQVVEPREFCSENNVDAVDDAAPKTQPDDSGDEHKATATASDKLPALSERKATATASDKLPTLLPASSLEEVGAAVGGAKAAGPECAEKVDIAVTGATKLEAAVPGKPGRVALAEHEAITCFSIQNCSVPSMDAFMQGNASGLVLQGLDAVEPSADDPSVSYGYIEPRGFGPRRAQLRIAAKVILSPGRVEIQILDMTLGLADKRTGEIDFEGQALKLLFKTENTITWKEDGKGGIDVVNRSWSRSETRLPWWFPVPDSAMQRMVTFFVRQVVANGQKQTNTKLQAKFREWVSQPVE